MKKSLKMVRSTLVSFERYLIKFNFLIIFKEIPLTLLIQPPNLQELPNFDDTTTIDIYSTFPFSQIGQVRNRYFITKSSFEYKMKLIPVILDLEGATIRGGMVDFPPFLAGTPVVSFFLFKYGCKRFSSEIYRNLVKATQMFVDQMRLFPST